MKVNLDLITGLFKRTQKEMDAEQTLIYGIVEKMCSNQDSILVAAPGQEAGQFYIKNEINGYFIVLTGNCIKITNKELYLVRYFEMNMIKPLIELVNQRISEDCNKIQNNVFVSELDVLQNISDSL